MKINVFVLFDNKNKIFFCSLRATSGSGDPPSGTQNRHVSLANIATAFLSERKSSSRRQSSARRKKHLSIKDLVCSTLNSKPSQVTLNSYLNPI